MVVICKQATCSSTDLPPSPGFPSFPPPSAVEVYLEEDAMNILEHSVTPVSAYGNNDDDATWRRLVALFASRLIPYLPFFA